MSLIDVRTFNARRGRLRPGRVDALARLLPSYGLAEGEVPEVLEIGSGMGEATVAIAAAEPSRLHLAVEVHTAGVANLLALIEAGSLDNVRVVRGDAVAVVRERLAPASLHAIHVYFPDPWPKARHHKRRLIQPSHVELLASRLRVGGVLHCATDSAGYAEAMATTLEGCRDLTGGVVPRPAHRPVTRYERRAIEAGRAVRDLRFERVPA